MKDYEKAIYHYQLMLDYYDEFFIANYIYMADCQNRLGKKIDMPILSNSNFDKSPINLRVMYKYFTLQSTVLCFCKTKLYFQKSVYHIYMIMK